MAKSQWEIITRGQSGPSEPGRKRKPKHFDMEALAKKARESMNRAIGQRATGESTYWMPKVIK